MAVDKVVMGIGRIHIYRAGLVDQEGIGRDVWAQ